MTTFDTEFADFAVDDLIDEFGESVIYLPFGGLPRTINAIVNRSQPQGSVEGMPRATVPTITVSARNDATTGILRSEVNSGKDQIQLAIRKGQAVSVRTIANVTDTPAVRGMRSVAGMTKVEVK